MYDFFSVALILRSQIGPECDVIFKMWKMLKFLANILPIYELHKMFQKNWGTSKESWVRAERRGI